MFLVLIHMANSTALKAKQGFKIVHMNVRSLFGKVAEIGAYNFQLF